MLLAKRREQHLSFVPRYSVTVVMPRRVSPMQCPKKLSNMVENNLITIRYGKHEDGTLLGSEACFSCFVVKPLVRRARIQDRPSPKKLL
jgi:hypothetical protein